MPSWLTGKRILVTGGAGAFGRKFLRRAQEAGATSVTVFSRDEMKHAALKREWGAAGAGFLRCVIGDVGDREGLDLAMGGVDLVIHAAAMKHLPECEANAAASTRVNVFGTLNVANAFLRSAAEALVFLSTDKSPYASSVYGAQKYMGEKLVTEAGRTAPPGKRAFTLRYSNVMDSTGSVFHVFRQLLGEGRTATVNGSQTSRGFVSQDQAIAALEAGLASARGGEVLVLVPRVVRIGELAEIMRQIVGKGSVQVTESTGFVGEKESATLVMAEETGMARRFPELSAIPSVLLDFLSRHPERAPASLPAAGLTLEGCDTLSGAELRTFVAALM